MNALYKKLSADKIIIVSLAATSICLITSSICIAFFYRSLPPFVPVFNQMPWGYSRLTSTSMFFLPLFLSFLISIINTVIIYYFYDTMPLASRILAMTGALIAFFIVIFTIQTIQLIA